jgi:eukaryotic-like serine/threonine-protein kinase
MSAEMRRDVMVGPGEERTADDILDWRESLLRQNIAFTLDELCAGVSDDVRAEVERRVAAIESEELKLMGSPADDPAGDDEFTPAGKAGRYVNLRRHDWGGMGVLCLADDAELRRPVAYKVMKPRYRNDPDARRRFLNEAEITALLDHPGVVPVYGRVEDDSELPAYATQFVTGRQLKNSIAAFHAIDPRERARRAEARAALLRHLITTCNIVAYAHGKRVVHGDIKPSNVMIDDTFSTTRLVDWGLARVVPPGEEDAPGAGDGPARLGTFPYQSTVSGPATFASDIYALGVTLAWILAEGTVEPSSTAPALTLRLASDTPRALAEVARKAKHPDRSERYLSAADLAHDVQAILDDRPTSACKDPWPTRLRRWSNRNRTLVGMLGVLVLGVALGGPVAYLRERSLRGRAEAATTRAESERRRAIGFMSEMIAQAEQIGSQQASTRASKALLDRTASLLAELARQAETEPASREAAIDDYIRIGRIRFKLNQLPEAADALARANSLAERRFAQAPDDAPNRNRWASGLREWGVTQVKQGRAEEAERAWRKAAEVLEPVAGLAPDFRFTLARVYSALGNLNMYYRHNQPEAQRFYARGRDLAVRLAKEEPGAEEYQSALADIASNLGMSYQFEAMPDGVQVTDPAKLGVAGDAHRSALDLRRQLVQAEPGNPDRMANLASSFNHLGNVLQTRGAENFGDAEANYREALAILEPLAVAFPGVPSHRQDIAEIYQNVVVMLTKQQHLTEATAIATTAADLFSRLVKEQQDSPELFAHQGEIFEQLAETLRLQGKAVASDRFYDAAVAYARAAALWKEPDQKEPLAAKAVSVLKSLMDLGYFRNQARANQLHADAAFQILRSRPDYQALIGAPGS